ncbi:hypothetical protein HYV56_00380 [Candidatus Peregrinibacteria bacterium]|nr:hypothetical protein [Candidatus Peregrinibacteria bacterium]
MGLHRRLATAESTWHGKTRRALEAIGEDAWNIADTETLKDGTDEPKNHPVAKDKETTQRQFLEIMKLLEKNTECIDFAMAP